MHTTTGADGAADHGGAGPPDEVRTAIADAVTADTRRQDLLVEYGRALGPDPELAHLDDAALEHAVRVGAAEIAAATCRWLELLAELVIRGRWADVGARNPAHWLSWALSMGTSTAREHVRVALRLRECPLIRERFAAGRLSYSKARALTRVSTPDTEELLVQWADAAPAHVLDRIIADTRRQQRAESDPCERDDLGVTRRWLDDGTYELVLRTDAATGIEVEQHLDRLSELDATDDAQDDTEGDRPDDYDASPGTVRPMSRARREVDLVVGALAAAVEAGPADTSGGDRHLVVLHTTPAELLAASEAEADSQANAATDESGASAEAPTKPPRSPRRAVLVRDGRNRVRVMSARTLWRLACSARLDLAVSRDGHPADLGRRRRAPDAALRRLLLTRDRTCRFPGCGATRYLHAHHVVHWADGGPTDLSNLVLLCGHHHTTVHGGWELRPAGPGAWTFHPPGRTRSLEWAQDLPGAPAEALLAAARAHAHDLDPTARARLLQPPDWDGEQRGPNGQPAYDHSLTVGLLVERLAKAA